MSYVHEEINNGNIRLHIASAGHGPLVVMCHGFPGLWYSWRHQLTALARAGYHAVAMDMRGYGRSSRPIASAEYSFDKLSGDVLAVLDHFSRENAVLLGHDFGANLAWHMGIHHTDRISAIAPLSAPYDMELAGGCDVLPSQLFASVAANHFFHMHYYQSVGVAERSVRGRESEFLHKLFWALSAKGKLLNWENFPSDGTAYLDVLEEPSESLPWSWLSLEDMEFYLEEYLSAGAELAFAGGVNSYRVMDKNWHMFREFAHANIEVPAFFAIGENDPVYSLSGPKPFDVMKSRVKNLSDVVLIPNCGHFVQQEQPDRLNELLVKFLRSL
ncbi:MAG: alpha/beta fold hydrolase [Halioglobus sp.]